MKITNQAQADAVQKKLDALKECDYAFESQNRHPEIAIIEAALAAWNERKELEGIVLSEDALTELKHKHLMSDHPRYRAACMELRDNSLITRNASEVINDLGRAYLEKLAAHNPREIKFGSRVFRWGIYDEYNLPTILTWNTVDVHDIYKEMQKRWSTVWLEVREVKPSVDR